MKKTQGTIAVRQISSMPQRGVVCCARVAGAVLNGQGKAILAKGLPLLRLGTGLARGDIRQEITWPPSRRDAAIRTAQREQVCPLSTVRPEEANGAGSGDSLRRARSAAICLRKSPIRLCNVVRSSTRPVHSAN